MRSPTAVAATIGLAAILLKGQQPPVKTLGALEVEYAEPFTEVTGIRELRDGRVIVLDARDRSLHAIDLKAGKDTKIGRIGNGPGEYQLPLRLYALPGDSSVVFDMGNSATALVITPQGKAGGTIDNASHGGGPPLNIGSATDGNGRIYTRVNRRNVARNEGVGVARLDRATGRSDTVAFLNAVGISPLFKAPAGDSKAAGGGGKTARTGGPIPFMVWDQWAVAPDGRVAIVTVEPYRVAFVDARHNRVTGPVIAVEKLPVTEGHKKVYRDQHQRLTQSINFGPDGKQTFGLQRMRFDEPEAWPDFLPPFLEDAVQFGPDGMLWVQRTTAADAPPRFDVFDSAGRVAWQVVLPKQTRVVGFGAHSVYLVRVDDVDLQYLQRYSLPR